MPSTGNSAVRSPYYSALEGPWQELLDDKDLFEPPITSLDEIPNDGGCQAHCIAQVLLGVRKCGLHMRRVIADSDAAKYLLENFGYLLLCQSGNVGVEDVKTVRSIEEYKACYLDMDAKGNFTYWAGSFDLQLVSNMLPDRLLLVVDMKDNCVHYYGHLKASGTPIILVKSAAHYTLPIPNNARPTKMLLDIIGGRLHPRRDSLSAL
jgi:hypothetical protein